MYSLVLYPLIDKPTTITDTSATLVDNIFTNELHHNLTSGILFNDISDHLPIFALCEFNVTRRIANGFQYIRTENEDTFASLSSELGQQFWENVVNTNDANQAYDTFLNTFTTIFKKHCPVKKVSIKYYINKKPWFTNGLKRTCAKKKSFIKLLFCLDLPSQNINTKFTKTN